MASSTFIGFEELDQQLENLGRDSIRRIAKAGGDAVAKRMRDVIAERHHIVTGDMQRATEAGNVWETLGGARVEIYPGALHDTEGRNGFRNSAKAFVIENGKGQRRTKRSGGRVKNKTRDHFVTGTNHGYEQAAEMAMQAENEKILNENQ